MEQYITSPSQLPYNIFYKKNYQECDKNRIRYLLAVKCFIHSNFNMPIIKKNQLVCMKNR